MKILCQWHDDSTPSMEVYSDWAYCFVCGTSVRTESLHLPADQIQSARKPADLEANLAYIQQLPKKAIRGLNLPYDSSGYYIVWPDGKFYVKRTWTGEARYISPRGIPRPLFTSGKKNDTIVIVEGELNAASLKESIGEVGVDVVSPGSAPNLSKFLDRYLAYKTIIIISDRDAVGVVYGLDLKEKLTKANKKVIYHAVKKDFNEILQTQGKEAVQEEFIRALGVQSMPRMGEQALCMRAPGEGDGQDVRESIG